MERWVSEGYPVRVIRCMAAQPIHATSACCPPDSGAAACIQPVLCRVTATLGSDGLFLRLSASPAMGFPVTNMELRRQLHSTPSDSQSRNAIYFLCRTKWHPRSPHCNNGLRVGGLNQPHLSNLKCRVLTPSSSQVPTRWSQPSTPENRWGRTGRN
jgi:hypothetical protein